MNLQHHRPIRQVLPLAGLLSLGISCGDQKTAPGQDAIQSPLSEVSAENSGIIPSNASFEGKSLTQWLTNYTRWMFTGSDPETGTVGNVTFLPLPQGEPTSDDPPTFTGLLEMTLPAGTAFVLPCVGWGGERYADGSADEFLPEEMFVGDDAVIRCTASVDGQALDLSDHFVQGLLDPPLDYPEPTEYGAVALIWHETIGFVHPPMSVGEHTVSVLADFSALGGPIFSNTWDLTVTPPEQ